jgi:amino-acid N-acetyltransferase
MGLDWPHFWVAVDAHDRVVGCAQVKPHGDGTQELASVAVRPGWRGEGIASKLIARLQELQDPPLWLTCRSSLVPFYRRFGFVEVQDDSVMPRHFRRIRRLMNGVMKILPRSEYLAVMKWSAPA